MDFLKLFAFTSNSDTVEGRGHTITHGYTREKSLAEAIVRDTRYARYCTMGVQQSDDYKYMVRETNIRIYSSVDEYFENTPEARKARALAKLSDEDIEALGIKR